MNILFYILITLAAYLSAYIIYDLVLLVVNFVIREKNAPYHQPQTTFGIIVPAHNEELFLERLLKSINKQDYPKALFTAIVVADNCEDDTAGIARRNGALALERKDNEHRGKGYTLRFALEKIDLNEYDAAFIIDADSFIKEDLLKQLDKVFRNGRKIIQCYNGVANPDESWFTRLLDVSRTIGNEILLPAKQKLGLSSYLMGNGMCFSSEILLKYGWNAFTVGEDWEYYAKVIQAGETVTFASKAIVYHQESSSLKQATSQRMRWSSGRFAVAGKYGVGLFFEGLKELNIKKIDASLPLILPNPSLGMNVTIIGLILSLLRALVLNKYNLLGFFLLLVVVQIFIFLVGITHTRNKFRKFLSLFAAPVFLTWKMVIDILSVLGNGRTNWTRTERKK